MSKHTFWEALIVTVFIFGLGILLGIFIENSRTGRVASMYIQSEANLLDVQLQSQIFNLGGINCSDIIEKNLEFGDKIYNDARMLEKYEEANQITDTIIEQHKKYDLLRTMFWVNSINIKNKCRTPFHTVVYLYEYNSENIAESSKQETFSQYLAELKDSAGSDIILIPIAIDLNLSSVDLMVNKYHINGTSIIVDEKTVIRDVSELQNIPKYLSN